jgi:uncharacterized protein YvpB
MRLFKIGIGVIAACLLLAGAGMYYMSDSSGGAGGSKTGAPAPAATAAPTPEIKRGTITIVATDEANQRPIKGAVYTISAAAAGEDALPLETVTTDATGTAISSPLDYAADYIIRQQAVSLPYALALEELHTAVEAPNQEVATTNAILPHVALAEPAGEGEMAIKKVYIDVPLIMQKPELPNGCEITSLTAVLNYYGYKTTKTEMADTYLPKQAFSSKDGKLYGPDPNQLYAGDPRSQKGGFYSFAAPIVKAADNYFHAKDLTGSAKDISGSTREQLIQQLNAGVPVVVWTTLDMSKPNINYGWYLTDTGEYYEALVNLHVVVLNGYEDGKVHVMNPLQGQVTYDADVFFGSYEEMGSHALVVNG